LKHTDRLLVVLHVSSHAPASSAPRQAEGTCSMIRSTIEAKESILQVAAFLEGLKDAETDQEGTLSSFTASSL
jgi:hypothetical protein